MSETVTQRVVSLEMFIIDSVIQSDSDNGDTTRSDQIGGSGTYAMIGARIFLPASRLGMVVNYTPETLPGWMRDRLESFGQDMWYFKERQDGGGTTRSVQRYENNTRTEVLVDDLLITPMDFRSTPFACPLPTCLHMTSLLDRTKIVLEEVGRTTSDQTGWDPIIVWEPYYGECTPGNLEAIGRYIPRVDVFSPNHIEALGLCSIAIPGPDGLVAAIEQSCTQLALFRPRRAVVIRCGMLGACYAFASHPTVVSWVPAYWSEATANRVVDPTGAGNGFLGGLCAGLDEGVGLEKAVVWGCVAASFIVEQAGLPYLTTVEQEMWNGSSVSGRVADMMSRVNQSRTRKADIVDAD